MKRIAVFTLLLLGATFLHAQDAVSIMRSARDRLKMDSMRTVSRLATTARNGSTTERVIEQISKDGPNGSRTVIVFRSPATVAGTRFLTMENASGGTEQWIFLPDAGEEARRVSAQQSRSSFMGTDFSYDDISLLDRDVSLDTHTILREETLDGNPCYVIQSIPKDSSYQYTKKISWVNKNNFLVYKTEMYNQRGELIKLMEMSNYRDVQGRITPMQTKISTVGAGTSTTIYLENVAYDSPIPDSVFTTTFLETGRAR